MKTNLQNIFPALALLALATFNSQLTTANAQGTAFTYQGRLNDGGNPASGTYDLRFTIYDSLPPGANVVGGPLTNTAVAVSNGLFTATLDPGAGVFTGPARWLEIAVRTNIPGPLPPPATFTVLTSRQPLTPTPYAIYAESASAAGLSGIVPPNGLGGQYGNPIALVNSLNTFDGDGGGLTRVNAASLGGLSASNFWQTAGNGGTSPGMNYVGTSDNQALELHVNGGRAMRLEPTATVPNLIGGYSGNAVDNGAQGVVIGGGGVTGYVNHVSSTLGTLGGGSGNIIGTNASDSTIVGGRQNGIDNAWRAFIGGGLANNIQSNATYATIAGGSGGTIQNNSYNSVIGGGDSNTIQPNSDHSTIGGGQNNVIQPYAGAATISGGVDNMVLSNANSSAISGGAGNVIQANPNSDMLYRNGFFVPFQGFENIAGGAYNSVNQANFGVIDGGYGNLIQSNADFSSIGGGSGNTIVNDDQSSVISGGSGNSIQLFAKYSIIGGGVNNSVYSSSYGTIGGGYQNTVNRSSLSLTPEAGGTVPGGEYNWAGGFCAFAAGFHANSLHDGTFVWADDSSSANFSSTGNNQFLIRAQGGVGIGTASPDAQLTVNGTADKPGGGSWGTYSDARLKDVGANFTHGMAALAAIQPVHYHYKSDNPLHLPSQPDYVGVVAQQVQSAIPEAVQQNKAGYLVVNNDPIIWTMFNAIKELNQQREAETKAKDAEIAELKARLAELEQLMTEKTGGDK